MNLWATWCVPYRVEMPEIQELYERYGDRVRIVGVSLDSRGSEAQVRRFVEDIGVTFGILTIAVATETARQPHHMTCPPVRYHSLC